MYISPSNTDLALPAKLFRFGFKNIGGERAGRGPRAELAVVSSVLNYHPLGALAGRRAGGGRAGGGRLFTVLDKPTSLFYLLVYRARCARVRDGLVAKFVVLGSRRFYTLFSLFRRPLLRLLYRHALKIQISVGWLVNKKN